MLGSFTCLIQSHIALLQDLFVSFKIASAEELILGANAKLSDVKRLQWKTARGGRTETGLYCTENLFNIL